MPNNVCPTFSRQRHPHRTPPAAYAGTGGERRPGISGRRRSVESPAGGPAAARPLERPLWQCTDIGDENPGKDSGEDPAEHLGAAQRQGPEASGTAGQLSVELHHRIAARSPQGQRAPDECIHAFCRRRVRRTAFRNRERACTRRHADKPDPPRRGALSPQRVPSVGRARLSGNTGSLPGGGRKRPSGRYWCAAGLRYRAQAPSRFRQT